MKLILIFIRKENITSKGGFCVFMNKKIFMTVCIIIVSLSCVSICWAAVDYSGIIESESAWVADLQQPSGAIIMTRNHTFSWNGLQCYKIEPYFANLAVIGLLENPSITNIEVAKNWITWYLGHLNNPDYNGLYGSVYVYYADTTDNTEHSSTTYDSTDSYGATFLTLLKKYYDVTGDSTLLINNREKIEKIADSVIATQQSDGLTYAKPDYKIKFTMDNLEVYEGLKSIEYLERYVFNDSTKADYYKNKKNLCFDGIERYLWNNTSKSYDKYLNSSSDLSVFYPDATCQVFPIWNDVIDSRSLRAEWLYFKLNTEHYGWPYLNTSDDFPWALLCYTAALMGDKDRVDIFLKNVKDTYIDQGHPWPWYNMEASFTIRAAKLIRDKYNLALNKTVTVSSNELTGSYVNDGNLNNTWIGRAVDNEWIKIDLGTAKQFNRVLIKWGSDYADQYKIQVSDDGINFIDVYTVSDGNGGTDDNIFTVQNKRYIRLLFTHRSSANGVAVREVEVYYEPVNLALNKIVTASSQQADAAKSVDGNTSTRWGSDYSDNQWYKIDLGSPTTINKVVIDWEYAYDTVYSVQVSTDDSNYTTVYSTSNGNGGIDIITFTPTTARYVKILCTTRATPYGSSFWEVRVYNDTTNNVPELVNYALNKPASASSVQPNSTFTPDKAVDNDLSTRWSSAYSDNQWWKVDLGFIVNNIRRVVIRWEAAYATAYSIQVSTDDVNYTTVYSTTTGQGGTEEVHFVPVDARYIKILCTKRATPYGFSFWEFEVY